MTQRQIQDSYDKETIQLNSYDRFTYYRVPMFIFIAALFCITDGFQNVLLKNLNTDDALFRLAVFLSALSLTIFLLKKWKLKFDKFTIKQTNLREKILGFAAENELGVIVDENHMIVLKTKRKFYVKNSTIIVPSESEWVYIIIKPGTLLVRSIFNLRNSGGFVIGKGENKNNEKQILNRLNNTIIP